MRMYFSPVEVSPFTVKKPCACPHNTHDVNNATGAKLRNFTVL